MGTGFRRFVAPILVVTLTASSVPIALAQTDEERSGARAAADAGLKAHDAKKWTECVDLFTRAESLVHAPPHLLYIGRCYTQLGKYVKARETYLKMKNETIPADKPKAFHDAKAAGLIDLAAIEPKLAYVNVTVENAGSKPVIVTMDGVTIPPALVGIPKPTDPGEHKLQASTEGMASESVTVTLKEGQTENVKLELIAGGTVAKPTTDPPPAATATAVTTAPSPTTTTTSAPPQGDTGGSITPTLGFVALGVGAVGLGVGTFFFLRSSNKKSAGNELFTKYNCSVSCSAEQQSEVKAADSDAKSAKTLGFVFVGVGVVAVGAGIALILSGSSSKPAASAGIKVQPMIGLGSLGLQGTF